MKKISDAIVDFRKMNTSLSGTVLHQELNFDSEVHRRMLSIFQPGDYFLFVYNLKRGEFDYVSPEVESFLGHKRGDVTINLIVSSIHPEDLPWFLNFENKIVEFFQGLRPDQILKYKVRYDYRIRRASGEYIRILHQLVTLDFDPQYGGILRTIGVHTDITQLKKEGKPMLSLIGLEGEPSYIDIAVDKIFTPSPALISDREKEILHLLIEGNSSKKIADMLFISKETVSKHRKNILQKAKANSTPELVAMAITKGWI